MADRNQHQPTAKGDPTVTERGTPASGAADGHTNTGGGKGGPDDPRTVPGDVGQSPTVMSPKDLTPPGAGPVEEKPTRPRKDLKRGGAPGGALGES